MSADAGRVARVTSFGHQPALDGLRGLAVAAVLGFHLEIGWLSGGYLGVSLFFTLSGYLITSLLLTEHDRAGFVDLPAFYQRRARRLVPAGLLVLGVVVVLALLDVVQTRTTFRRDVVASMFQVLNWTRLFDQQSYADLFIAPSPVDHYWSLGIEEQFYVLWPITMVLLLRLLHRRAARHLLVHHVVAIWLLLSLSAPLSVWWWNRDAAYFATWARAAEVLAGAVLAVWLHDRRRRFVSTWVGRMAPLSLLASGVLVVVTPAGRGWAFAGGLPLFALISAGMVLGLQVESSTRALLSTTPLVWLGRVSYGVYLFHWPVFVVLDQQRTQLSQWPLAALRLAVTGVLATASYHLVERPIRERRRLPSARRLTVALGSTVVLVGVLALLVGVPASSGSVTAPSIITAPSTTAHPGSTQVAPPSTTPTAPTVLAIFGDSVPAWMLRDGAASFSRSDVTIVNGSIEGCDGAADIPPGRDRQNVILQPDESCVEWPTWYPRVLDTTGHVDVALIMVGITPVIDHRIDGVWLGPCEDLRWYVDDVAARVDTLRSRGVEVVFALPATLGSRSLFMMPVDHPTRMACVRAALSSMLADRQVPVVDLQPYLCPNDDCDAIRPADGVHIVGDAAGPALDWLVGETMAARRDQVDSTG